MRTRLLILFPLLLVAAGAADAGLPKNTEVRFQSASINPGWHEGTVRVAANGCTMVYLKTKTPDGYESVALMTVDTMQRRDGAKWLDVDLKPLLAVEPAECKEAFAD